MILRNLLKPDYRRKYWKAELLQAKKLAQLKKRNFILGVLTLLVLAVIVLWSTLSRYLPTPLLDPRGTSGSTVKVQEVRAEEIPCDFDAITYIRCSGTKLGKDNQTIMTMIRIARYESRFNPKAKNPHSTAKGIFQILDGTWNAKANRCVGNAYNFKQNIDCAWIIQGKRGFQPWVVFTNGLAR